MHATQAGRDRDQLTDTGNETTDESGYIASLPEILLCALQFLAGEQAHMSQPTVGELIDDQSSQPYGETIIDDRPYHRTERTEEYDD